MFAKSDQNLKVLGRIVVPSVRVRVASICVYRPTIHVAHLLCVLRLRIVTLPQRREAIVLRPGVDRWEEVEDEAPHVEDVDECNNPLEDGGSIAMVSVAFHSEANDEADFDEDEGHLDPERCPEDSILTVVDPQSLVLCVDEDCRDDVSRTNCPQSQRLEIRVLNHGTRT